MKTKIKLEEGKWYKTRDGQVVGPIKYDPEDSADKFPYIAGQELDAACQAWFREDGTWGIDEGVEHHFDIIEEVSPVTSTAQQDFLDSTPEHPNKLERLEARVAKLESMLA